MTTPPRYSVLVVDDAPVIHKAVARLLAECGITEYHSAFDGHQCLEMMADTHYDLVLLDLIVPEMDGIEVLGHLGKLDQRPAVILVSSVDRRTMRAAKDVALAHRIPLLGHLDKPFTAPALSALIDKMNRVDDGAHPASVAVLDLDHILSHLAEYLDVYYQPKTAIATGALLGVEALARWCEPGELAVLPAAFIPQLEESGNSRLLFDLVAAKALDAAAQWKTAGMDIPIAINASADDITCKGFADDVAAMIANAGIAPENAILEVTETKLPTDFAEFLSTLTRLSIKGLNLSIDDFGCGTSTLQQIRQMPFSELKIDSQFVLNVAENKDNQAIVTSCIDLAAKLALRTVAEGIEREEDKSFLLANGCEIGQGYLVSRPAPFDDIIHFAAESWSAAS